MKKTFFLTFFALIFICSVFSHGKTDKTQKYKLNKPKGNKIEFAETWGYVVQNREEFYNENLPISDVCYFAADFNCYGELIDIPKRSNLKISPNSRCHIVFICDNVSLTHFLITPQFSLRDSAIQQIVDASKDFDGVQLDFELVPQRDNEIFLEFVQLLKSKLEKTYGKNKKIYTICVPARTKLLQNDIFPYEKFSEIFDRIFVMAYDEHWSTSSPGPIASLEWCEKITNYANSTIPSEKLIMGIPFYARTWVDETPQGAWIFETMNKKFIENNVKKITYENEIPTTNYKQTVNVKAYFNDAYSLVEFCRFYKNQGIQNVGFWRIGQEDTEFWNWIKCTSHYVDCNLTLN